MEGYTLGFFINTFITAFGNLTVSDDTITLAANSWNNVIEFFHPFYGINYWPFFFRGYDDIRECQVAMSGLVIIGLALFAIHPPTWSPVDQYYFHRYLTRESFLRAVDRVQNAAKAKATLPFSATSTEQRPINVANFMLPVSNEDGATFFYKDDVLFWCNNTRGSPPIMYKPIPYDDLTFWTKRDSYLIPVNSDGLPDNMMPLFSKAVYDHFHGSIFPTPLNHIMDFLDSLTPAQYFMIYLCFYGGFFIYAIFLLRTIPLYWKGLRWGDAIKLFIYSCALHVWYRFLNNTITRFLLKSFKLCVVAGKNLLLFEMLKNINRIFFRLLEVLQLHTPSVYVEPDPITLDEIVDQALKKHLPHMYEEKRVAFITSSAVAVFKLAVLEYKTIIRDYNRKITWPRQLSHNVAKITEDSSTPNTIVRLKELRRNLSWNWVRPNSSEPGSGSPLNNILKYLGCWGVIDMQTTYIKEKLRKYSLWQKDHAVVVTTYKALSSDPLRLNKFLTKIIKEKIKYFIKKFF